MCETMDNFNALKDIQEIKDSVNKIQIALLGNEYNPLGALQQINDVETRVRAIEKSIIMVKYVATGFGLAGTGVGALIVKAFSLFK